MSVGEVLDEQLVSCDELLVILGIFGYLKFKSIDPQFFHSGQMTGGPS